MSHSNTPDGPLHVFEGWCGGSVTLVEADIVLLRLALKEGRLYSSDNEAKWDRVLEARLLEGVPGQPTDWYGGFVQLSERGRAFLGRLDAQAPGAETSPA